MALNDKYLAELLPSIVVIARRAGQAIMEVYAQNDFGTIAKSDDSPLTKADLASHKIITELLDTLTPSFPVLSEESPDAPYEIRKNWEVYWLVDPLDGTKEFLKRNDEFTVNIALIESGAPVLGVVFAPALGVLYYAARHNGSFKEIDGEGAVQIAAHDQSFSSLRMVVSRSHGGADLENFLKNAQCGESVPTGSSLKFCVVAEGAAHLYPRFGPTREWDTAAAHCIVTEAGGTVTNFKGESLVYNKPELLNPYFMVSGKREFPWRDWL